MENRETFVNIMKDFEMNVGLGIMVTQLMGVMIPFMAWTSTSFHRKEDSSTVGPLLDSTWTQLFLPFIRILQRQYLTSQANTEDYEDEEDRNALNAADSGARAASFLFYLSSRLSEEFGRSLRWANIRVYC